MEVINAFPGYEYVIDENNKPHNMYMGEDVGFGGYVFARPGMYGRTVCFDVSGMHPASIRALNCLGEYTKNFGDICTYSEQAKKLKIDFENIFQDNDQ